jgi:hypothetical protein
MSREDSGYYNKSGYRDPTAGKALSNLHRNHYDFERQREYRNEKIRRKEYDEFVSDQFFLLGLKGCDWGELK